MPPSRRSRSPSSGRKSSSSGHARRSRRRVLHVGAVALAGSIAGCTSGILSEKSEDGDGTTSATAESPTIESTDSEGTTDRAAEAEDRTTLPTGMDTSLPEGSVEWPEGPKSPPERPAVLTAESVREYVHAFEYRYVYNELHYDEPTEVHEECGVESVSEYGEGFRAVVWCSAYSNTGGDGGTTLHADYFTQYATYFVGPDTTVRREGRSKTRE